ncbi:UNVERIFIED_CONTAM: hypothetical protein NCL1_22148 [Trichonephila clavipes]
MPCDESVQNRLRHLKVQFQLIYVLTTLSKISFCDEGLGLSNYTPQVLSSNNEFELGVSQSNHRPTSLPEKCQTDEEVVAIDVIIPANPDDTGGWSATETADILF